ncbi:hypothetical protein [Loktanella sp. M215]|uniref:hypothetical protein n=1 Tax=Loktanella sp. M215 TaxID=2675431 RepID=UPI001F1797FE|nr:hypothetical protein [Loktanella sp. M215]MBU2359615.1 hypothetical protein [Alphaproteobacteria bacterium]MCF7697946.1 hypothetical protein [Loktanella sp. M215]
MPHFNRSFELTIADIDLIESSLRETGRALADARIDAAATDPAGLPDLDARIRRVNKLLGRLHNQKTFFRPTAGTYVGG